MKPYVKISAMLVVAVAGMWMVAAASFAHHLWVMEKDGVYVVGRGHIGESVDLYDPACVKKITAFAGDGTEIAVTRADDKNRAMFTAATQPALVSVVSQWGDRVNTTRGKRLMNRKQAEAEGLRVISAFTSTQYSKTVFGPSDITTRPLGIKFEIVPLADPATLSAGVPLLFKLLFDGRPLSGVSVLTNYDQEATTDEDGVAEVVFDKPGVHLLFATHQIPADDASGLDFYKFMTFLTFEVKK